ncbi:MAG: FtsL-like putative cell division protein [Alistipes sp.]
MAFSDHEFDPITPEELAAQERAAELSRRVRREVRHEMQRVQEGKADEDLLLDQAEEQAAKEATEELRKREHRRSASTFWQLLTGTILVHRGASKYYPYMFAIAVMFFLSIAVMFTALHWDKKYTRLEREVQILREHSIRLQEQRYRCTTHSAIVEQLRARGIELYDPEAPGETIEN